MWRSGDWFFFLFFFLVSFIIGDHRYFRVAIINCTGGFTENSSCSVRGIVKMIGEELVLITEWQDGSGKVILIGCDHEGRKLFDRVP